MITKETPVAEFTFQDYNGKYNPSIPSHVGLICKNHPECQYITKNPYQRGLHYVSMTAPECKCPFNDLVVITAEA